MLEYQGVFWEHGAALNEAKIPPTTSGLIPCCLGWGWSAAGLRGATFGYSGSTRWTSLCVVGLCPHLFPSRNFLFLQLLSPRAIFSFPESSLFLFPLLMGWASLGDTPAVWSWVGEGKGHRVLVLGCVFMHTHVEWSTCLVSMQCHSPLYPEPSRLL